MIKFNQRTIFVCNVIPPFQGGASSIIGNILKSKAFSDVYIAGRESRINNKLFLKKRILKLPLSFGSKNLFIRICLYFISFILLVKFIRDNDIKNVVAVYRDQGSFVLGFLSSFFTRTNLFVYMTDLYAENYKSILKTLIQKIIFNYSKKIFCLNDAMLKYYLKKYNGKTFSIPHTVNNCNPRIQKVIKDSFSIAYVGSITFDRIDLLRNLIEIVNSSDDLNLVLYTNADPKFLEKHSLAGMNIKSFYINDKDILLDRLSTHNLMYLPLAFDEVSTSSYIQIKTSFATKSMEYLLSGCPILVNASSDTFTFQYLKNNNAAILLDSDKIVDLKKTIYAIKNNDIDTQEILNNSKSLLKKHHIDNISSKFLNLINQK